jgi:hypothetical protein
MLRSAVVPGWGQLYNHQPLKAAAVVGGEGFLFSRILRELKLQNDAIDRVSEGDSTALLDADLHRNRKVTWIWWTVAAHLLQMADAYVDAHLSTFAADLRVGERSPARRRDDAAAMAGPPESPDPALTLALRVRF